MDPITIILKIALVLVAWFLNVLGMVAVNNGDRNFGRGLYAIAIFCGLGAAFL